MAKTLARFGSLVRMSTTISEAIALMGNAPINKHIAGIVVVLNDKKHVVGVVTDGDIRRGFAKNIGPEQTVERIANLQPLTVNRSMNTTQMRRFVMDEARRRNANYLKYDKLILVEDDGSFYDVIRLADIMETQMDEKIIAVYGLGFVGLTLACTFANAGLSVVGIDTNPKLIEGLKKGIAPFYEKGLDSMLSSLASANPIHYTNIVGERSADVHVVSVGSPVDDTGQPDLSHIKAAATTIATHLKHGDLVVFRSTVPVGTIRQIVLPILQAGGLVCGTDFHLSFAPERTVEGNALEELRLLPQIIGGYNRASTQLTAKLFRHITHTIIEVKSLEEAELVKLMNNTFRDVVFSFANEVASICEGFNINAFDIIRAANEGYPRDKIAMPSPGVGGICLSKDPYLYTHPIAKLATAPILGETSRRINTLGTQAIYDKLERFATHIKRPLKELNILIVGLAFKGMPETSDIRASVTLDILDKLPDRSRIRIKDFVVSNEEIEKLGCIAESGELVDSCAQADIVLVMNNHYRNNKFNVIEALRRSKHPILFFDGWNMFNQREIESASHVCYATMGYMTPAFKS